MKHFLWILFYLGTISISHGAFFKESSPEVSPLEIDNFQTLGILNIGYIVAEGTGSCTATILNSKTIITAAHCIAKGNEWVRDGKIVFNISLNGGKLIPLRVKRKWTPTQNPLINYASVLDAHLLDIALLEPIEQVQLNKTIYLAEEKPAAGLQILNIGITTFVKSIIVFNKSCQIKSNFHDYVYNMNCGGIRGMSGSGIFVQNNGDLRIIGLLNGVKSNEPPFKLMDYSDEIATYGPFFDDSFPLIREMKKHL